MRIQDIDNALNNAFSQRQISTIYSERNQYRVILEVDPLFQRDPSDLTQVYVAGQGNTQVPLSSVARIEKTLAPLVINHQGSFPAVTITYNLAPNIPIETASRAIEKAVAELHLPDTLHTEFAGDAKVFQRSVGAQPLVILAALLAIYIILGVLYESLAHPLTIISTLPSAGLGALLALQLFGAELTVIAFIGIILLDRHRQEERHHDGGLRAVGGARGRPLARRGDPRGVPGALPADHDDDAGRDARRRAADDRDRAGLGAAAAARHDHRRRPPGVADPDALHHAGDLSVA